MPLLAFQYIFSKIVYSSMPYDVILLKFTKERSKLSNVMSFWKIMVSIIKSLIV